MKIFIILLSVILILLVPTIVKVVKIYRDSDIVHSYQSSKILSPDGKTSAEFWETKQREGNYFTQVLLSFNNTMGEGGSGAVSFSNCTGAELEITWIDKDTLEIKYPEGVLFRRNASGEKLQFGPQFVTVKLTPYKKNI